ncbi:DNA mismatch repair protein-like protein MutS [Coniochaeta sp. 2T2.1]|nr:DNA mismatch repair protein-like protein MutS [Coniochaeta sp. 2T2.1]
MSYRSTTSNSRKRVATPAPSTISGRKSRCASSIGGTEKHEIICAVSEARGVTPSVGIAFVNIDTGEAILSQICDTQFYIKTTHQIAVYDPSRILMVSTTFPPNPVSTLNNIIATAFKGRATLVPLDRRYWSEKTGLEYLQDLAFRDDVEAIKVAIEGNFYATCSLSAALKYLEGEFQVRFAPHGLRIKYQSPEATMMIDLSAIVSLELIQNLQQAKSKDCLFGFLNQALTPMGSRMLRANILQPYTMTADIEPRYDALGELTSNEEMFHEVRKALQDFDDVEKLLTKLVLHPIQSSTYHAEQAINNVLIVKKFVSSVAPIFESLIPAQCNLLRSIRDTCRPEVIQPILGLINTVIEENATFVKKPLDLRHQRTYAVKSGINGLLDVARKTYEEVTDDLYEYVEELNREHDIAAEKKFDNTRKLYLRLRAADFEHRQLPDELINRVQKKAYIECQTLRILKLNQRIDDSNLDTVTQSDKVVSVLLEEIRKYVPEMFKVCESIALLDVLAAFGQIVTTQEYVRPVLSGNMAIKSARHPVLEKVSSTFIPNDYYATEQHRFQIITGCNMSGKSTYIRTAALCQVMAQIGCFVPAEYASFPLIHNLFSRTSTDDCIEANMSTFSVEMREMAFILRNINGKSLTIIDELGRGTSTCDGLAIALAMAEALVQSGAFVFFATHFTDLAKILANRPGVLNRHLATETTLTDDNVPKMTMLYKIESGPVREESYGIKLAGAVGFPARFLEVAEHVSTKLREQAQVNKRDSAARKLEHRRTLILNLHGQLQMAYASDMEDGALAAYLKKLQAEFIQRMEENEAPEEESGDDQDVEEDDQHRSEVVVLESDSD